MVAPQGTVLCGSVIRRHPGEHHSTVAIEVLRAILAQTDIFLSWPAANKVPLPLLDYLCPPASMRSARVSHRITRTRADKHGKGRQKPDCCGRYWHAGGRRDHLGQPLPAANGCC